MADAPAPGPSGPRITRPTWIDRVQRIRAMELFEKYRRRMVHQETGLPFDPSPRGDSPLTFERLAFETGWGLRMALRVFFPVCFSGFLASFFLPEGVAREVLRSCSVAGMIGFGTNWVAIKMLFWPRQVRPVFGQGLIPSQRDQLIEKVANEVLEKLINEELIFQKIEETQLVRRFSEALIAKLRGVVKDPEFQVDLKNMVLTYVGDMAARPDFRAQVAAKAERSLEEFAGTSFKSWVVRRLREVWRPALIEVLNREVEELDATLAEGFGTFEGVLDRLPHALEVRQEAIDRVLTSMLLGLVREVDMRAIVLEQLDQVTAQQLEEGFREFSDDKLSFITLLGGLLGVVGGPVIIWPLPSLAVLGSLALLLTVTDVLAQPLMESRYWPRRARSASPKAGDGAAGAAARRDGAGAPAPRAGSAPPEEETEGASRSR